MSKLFQRLRDLEAKATPGEWMPCLGSGNIECTSIHFVGNEKYPGGLFVCDLVPDWALEEKYAEDLKMKQANMEFICELRNSNKKLLAVIDLYEDFLNKIRARWYEEGIGEDAKEVMAKAETLAK